MGGAGPGMVRRVVLYGPSSNFTVPDGISVSMENYGPLRSVPNPVSLILAAIILFGPCGHGTCTLTRSLS